MKPGPIDLDAFQDSSLLIRFEELNEDSLQILFRDPCDKMLSQSYLKELPFTNDYIVPFRTAISRYRLQRRNAFLFWETLREDYQKIIVNAYCLSSKANILFFFAWIVRERQMSKQEYQRVVDEFYKLTDDKKMKLIENYNTTLQTK
jgi:hypothetical protein